MQNYNCENKNKSKIDIFKGREKRALEIPGHV